MDILAISLKRLLLIFKIILFDSYQFNFERLILKLENVKISLVFIIIKIYKNKYFAPDSDLSQCKNNKESRKPQPYGKVDNKLSC
jgi:hypothetical protein